MVAKLIAYGADRGQALGRLGLGLAQAQLVGPKSNLAFLSALIGSDEVRAGQHDTGFIDKHLAELGAAPKPPEPRATLAAAEAILFGRPKPGTQALDPWAVDDAFELTGRRATPFDLRVDGQAERLVLEEKGAERILRFADGRDAGPPAPVSLYFSDGGYFALCRGRQSRVDPIDPLQGPPAGSTEATGEIVAPMHGRLIALFVAEGEEVAEGQRVAVVEAMKMEHTLSAARPGRVSGLTAKTGDTVEQGQKLMSISEGS
jgi:3-methylcrotonyl-CoA carboxylase alpha subunit